jgi:hypothetical protein
MLNQSLKRHAGLPEGKSKRRCLPWDLTPPSKTALSVPSTSHERLTICQQAEPYRLVTAIFPIDVLTPVWKQGSNRPLNDPHKRRLCQAFHKDLHNSDPNNALRLACSKQEIERMVAELERQGQARTDWKRRTPDSWPSFMEWGRVNAEPVELMAGNHRVEALKEYLREENLDTPKERWWLCDVYDQGEWVALGTNSIGGLKLGGFGCSRRS